MDNQINQINTQKETIKTEIDNILTEIAIKKTEIEKINTEIVTIKNDIEKIKNANNTLQSKIALLDDKKARLDYAQMVKEPTSSLYPLAPKKKVNVALAGVLGLFVFTMLAFFMEYVSKQQQKAMGK